MSKLDNWLHGHRSSICKNDVSHALHLVGTRIWRAESKFSRCIIILLVIVPTGASLHQSEACEFVREIRVVGYFFSLVLRIMHRSSIRTSMTGSKPIIAEYLPCEKTIQLHKHHVTLSVFSTCFLITCQWFAFFQVHVLQYRGLMGEPLKTRR